MSQEPDLEVFFRFDRGEIAPPWPELEPFLERLEKKTGLARQGPEWPSDETGIRRAAAALTDAAMETFGATLNPVPDDRHFFDAFLNKHVIDPAGRPFFDGAQVRESLDEKAYATLQERGLRLPDAPLLVYCLTAYWGEVLRARLGAVWCLLSPIRPLQKLFDMLQNGPISQCHLFSQVTKKLLDPEGDQLAFKVSAIQSPGVALCATMEEAEPVAERILGKEGLAVIELLESEDENQINEGLERAEKLLERNPKNGLILYYAGRTALQAGAMDVARHYLERLVELSRNPMNLHNLSIAVAQEDLGAAIGLAEEALRLRPEYWRCCVTLASYYVDARRNADAKKLLQKVVKQSEEPGIAEQAKEFLREIS